MTRILLTASGANGSFDLIEQLHKYGHYVHGVDTNPNADGRFFADRFTVVSPAKSGQPYVDDLIRIAKEDSIDVIYPQSDLDLFPLSGNLEKFPCKVAISGFDALDTANDKFLTYEAIQDYRIIPQYYMVHDEAQFMRASDLLDVHRHKKAVVCRPPVSKGGRGAFVMSRDGGEAINRLPHYTFREAQEIVKARKEPLLMTEFLDGEEIDSMAICEYGEVYLITHKTRDAERCGNITEGVVVDRPLLDAKVKRILDIIPLSYNVSIQFKGGKLLEINPRSSTYIYGDDFCEPELAIGLITGKYTADSIREKRKDIPYGRHMKRYTRLMLWDENKNGSTANASAYLA